MIFLFSEQKAKAKLAVFDHPFAAVSDENGVLEIKGIPAGGEIDRRTGHLAAVRAENQPFRAIN